MRLIKTILLGLCCLICLQAISIRKKNSIIVIKLLSMISNYVSPSILILISFKLLTEE